MVTGLNPGLWICAVILLSICGCATTPVDITQTEFTPDQVQAEVAAHPQPGADSAPSSQKASFRPSGKDLSTLGRAITEKQLRKLVDKDPDLEFYRCLEILCRLNRKDKEYIREDMKQKRPLIVPKHFSSYRDWSPLPEKITAAEKVPKLILVVKDIHFLGWYKNGKLVGDTYVCLGKMNAWTRRGTYAVMQKDPCHTSTYPNAYGEPAFMPEALHIYDRVWIHTGDVIGPNCSHGCINVPLAYSDKLYDWAEVGTAVLITESLKDLRRDIKTARLENPRQKTQPAKEQGKQDKRQEPMNEQRNSFLETATKQ